MTFVNMGQLCAVCFSVGIQPLTITKNSPDDHLLYNDVIMSAMATQITSMTIVCSAVCSDSHQRKHQRSASLAFVWGIHWWPVNSPHTGPVTRKIPFHEVIMYSMVNTAPLSIDTKSLEIPLWWYWADELDDAKSTRTWIRMHYAVNWQKANRKIGHLHQIKEYCGLFDVGHFGC